MVAQLPLQLHLAVLLAYDFECQSITTEQAKLRLFVKAIIFNTMTPQIQVDSLLPLTVK